MKTSELWNTGCRAALFWCAAAAPATAQQVVELTGEDRWLEPGFEEVYRLGSMTGAEWEQFGEIADVAFDGAGHLHVLDRQARLVHVVGGDGRLIRQLGGPGEGPGEFGDPAAMAVFADGRVVVVDLDRRGYHIFAAGGQFERMVRMAEPGVASIGRVVAHPGAEAVVGVPTQARVMLFTGAVFSVPVRFPVSHPVVRTNLSGAETGTDTIVEAWLPPIDTEGPAHDPRREGPAAASAGGGGQARHEPRSSTTGDRGIGVPRRTVRHSRFGDDLGRAHLGVAAWRRSPR